MTRTIACLAVLALLFPLPARAEEPAATVLDVSGPVTWRAVASEAFHAAHGGDRLFPGAEVLTGVQGFATLRWRNGGTFKLLPASDLVVPPGEGVRVNAGKVWAEFKQKLLAPFYFQGPSATAVVRGTVLDVQVLDQGATRVEVFEGHVEVTGSRDGRHIMLDPGQSMTVSPFGQLGPVEPVSPLDRMGANRPLAMRTMPGGGIRSVASWLDGNRAAVRMEEQRTQMRRAMMVNTPAGPMVVMGGQAQAVMVPGQPGLVTAPGQPVMVQGPGQAAGQAMFVPGQAALVQAQAVPVPGQPGLVTGQAMSVPGQPGLMPGQAVSVPGQPGLVTGQPGLVMGQQGSVAVTAPGAVGPGGRIVDVEGRGVVTTQVGPVPGEAGVAYGEGQMVKGSVSVQNGYVTNVQAGFVTNAQAIPAWPGGQCFPDPAVLKCAPVMACPVTAPLPPGAEAKCSTVTRSAP